MDKGNFKSSCVNCLSIKEFLRKYTSRSFAGTCILWYKFDTDIFSKFFIFFKEVIMAKWIIDADHSVAAFVIKHMMVSNVRGQFNKLAGVINFDAAEISHSSVEATIEVSGIYTGIQKRDDHLRSPDFFDAARYPFITFKGNEVESTGQRSFKVIGDLTMRGITKVVTLNGEYAGPEKSEGETSIGFAAWTKVNREDFGLRWNVDLESGGFMVGKDVEIFLDIEADLSEGA